MPEQRKWWETNRDMKTKPKAGFTYCGGCDRYQLPDGAKCPHCGWVNGPTKRRKRR